MIGGGQTSYLKTSYFKIDNFKLNNMGIIFIFEFLLKAAFVVLGILAWQGHQCAFITFLVLAGVIALFDIVAALSVFSADRDIRNKIP